VIDKIIQCAVPTHDKNISECIKPGGPVFVENFMLYIPGIKFFQNLFSEGYSPSISCKRIANNGNVLFRSGLHEFLVGIKLTGFYSPVGRPVKSFTNLFIVIN